MTIQDFLRSDDALVVRLTSVVLCRQERRHGNTGPILPTLRTGRSYPQIIPEPSGRILGVGKFLTLSAIKFIGSNFKSRNFLNVMFLHLLVLAEVIKADRVPCASQSVSSPMVRWCGASVYDNQEF